MIIRPLNVPSSVSDFMQIIAAREAVMLRTRPLQAPPAAGKSQHLCACSIEAVSGVQDTYFAIVAEKLV